MCSSRKKVYDPYVFEHAEAMEIWHCLPSDKDDILKQYLKWTLVSSQVFDLETRRVNLLSGMEKSLKC